MKVDDNCLPIKTCINCGSDRVYFDQEFRFYRCETCCAVWGRDENDPNYYDELIEEAKFHNNKYTKELYPDTPDEPA